jgi:hypothetical protein
MKAFLAVVFLALATASPGAGVHTGEWERGSPEAGGGRLLTRERGGVVEFQLECWRGAPSHNSGFLSGTLAVAEGKGVFRSQGEDLDCELAFGFSDNKVDVEYVKDARECGFGQGVSASGSYSRRNTKEPQFADGDARPRE